MKPIAIAIADVHVNDWKQHSQYIDRLHMSLLPLILASREAARYKIPILLPGDLVHNSARMDNKVLDAITAAWQEHLQYVDVVAISGNHDMVEKNTPNHRSPSYIESLSRAWPKLHCIDEPGKSWSNERIAVHGIPFLTHNEGFRDLLRKEEKVIMRGKINILLVHRDLPKALTPSGFSLGESDDITLSRISKHFDLVLAGHVHKPMRLYKKSVYMLGAPGHQDMGDMGTDMGYWWVMEDGSMKFRPGLMPEFKYLKKGEPIPNHDHYWVYRDDEPEESEDDVSMKAFSIDSDRGKLARAYCKAIGEDDKKKIQLLTDLLNEAQ